MEFPHTFLYDCFPKFLVTIGDENPEMEALVRVCKIE